MKVRDFIEALRAKNPEAQVYAKNMKWAFIRELPPTSRSWTRTPIGLEKSRGHRETILIS